MDQRTKNRLREHGGENHTLELEENRDWVDCFKGPGKYFVCSCGWEGWLAIP